MEYVKPGYVAPMYQPMPAQMPISQPMPYAVQPTAPIMQKPLHTDIHLHAAYQQTSYHFPKPVGVKPVAISSYSSAGSILVLFILLVIITRGICKY